MNRLLVCQNSSCRFLLDAGKKQIGLKPEVRLEHCPECGSGWSTRCPYCNTALEAVLRSGSPPACFSCGQTMKPEIGHAYATKGENSGLIAGHQSAFD